MKISILNDRKVLVCGFLLGLCLCPNSQLGFAQDAGQKEATGIEVTNQQSGGSTEDQNMKNQNWTRPKDQELRSKLSDEQYRVTQKQGTERPFHNAYWDNKSPGIYVDVVSGQPLFSSTDKFDSGTGWPSFSKPIEEQAVKTETDSTLGMDRTEVRSAGADSHLGHVFDDGPGPKGERYCINSASLKFVPAEKLESEGYGKFVPMFGKLAAESKTESKKDGVPAAAPKAEVVVLAGGCFWGMEDIIRQIPGVIDTQVGYAGGGTSSPTYDAVKTGTTGHAEAVQVRFDPTKLSFEKLLAFFFRMHDPTTLNRQGNDRGTQYRSAIFYESEEQHAVAERVKDEVNKSGKWKNPVVTEITQAGEFTPAEDYHQDYLQKHPGGYTCHFLRPE